MNEQHEFAAYTFEKGEYAEGYDWQIVYNTVYEPKRVSYHENMFCKHAIRQEDGSVVIPRLVECYNEGRHNSTQLCLDCLLEAVKGIEGGSIKPDELPEE
jgi:hypothetical protein